MRLGGAVRWKSRAVAVSMTGALAMGTWLTTPAGAESVPDGQWYLKSMKAESMWEKSTGEGITVAVIDSGVDASHPDLRGQVLPGRHFAPHPVSATRDTDGHGTAMAALVAGTGRGRNGQGSRGLAPGARILPLRVGTHVEGRDRLHVKELAKAIRFAADSDAKIINISLGTHVGRKVLTAAINYALSKKKLIFAAAGNDAKLNVPIGYPGEIPGVVVVGNVGKDGRAAATSQHNSQMVELAAPGEGIESASAGDHPYRKGSGTSASSALAAASAALIWSKYPDWTANQVLRVMINTAGGPTDGAERNDYIGYGIVRPRVALANPGDPGPANVSPLPEVARAAKPDKPVAKPSSAPPTDSSSRTKKDAQATAADGKSGDETGPPWGMLAGSAVGGAVVAALIVLLLRRRRSADGATEAGLGPPPGTWR